MFKRSDVKDMYSLSPMQEGMLFHYIMDRDTEAYFEQMSYEICGRIDVRKFETAFNQLIQRYDVLRTVFVYRSSQKPRQVLLKNRTAEVYYEDITQREDREKNEYIESFKEQDRKKGFDLTKDLLIRVAVLKRNEAAYEIVWSFHHIIMDGWCTAVLIKDMMDIYRGLLENSSVELPPVRPYRDYIKWLERQDRQKGSRYWKEYLEGYETKAGIPGRDNSIPDTFEQEHVIFTLDREQTTALSRMASLNNVTISQVFHVLWGILLQRYNNVDDVVFGSVVSGRPAELPGIETMVGLFINTVPVRITSETADTFKSQLEKIREQTLVSREYEYVSLPEIQADTALNRDLIDHIVVFENYPVERTVTENSKDNHNGLIIRDVSVSERTSYHLDVIVAPGEELYTRIQYNRSVYDDALITAIPGHLKEIVRQVTTGADIPLNRIEILTETEKSTLLRQFNDTEAPYPGEKTLHRIMEEQALKTPDNAAIISDDNRLTYRQLNEKSNRLARRLRQLGIGPDTVVACRLQRSMEMMIGIFAVLKAGGAYLPIAHDGPGKRTRYLLNDSAANVLLTTGNITENISENKSENISPDERLELPIIDLREETHDNFSEENLDPLNSSGDMAYIIYTSGSTGQPKGVVVEHRSVINRLNWMQRAYPLDKNDVIMQKTTYTFDVSVWELFWWSFVGASLYLLPPGGEKNPREIVAAVSRRAITTMHFVPTMLTAYLEYVEERGEAHRLKSVRQVFSSGEALTLQQVKWFNRQFLHTNQTRLHNLYGPTEATVDVTYYDCSRNDEELPENIPIGKPIDNTRLYILDNHGNHQPVGIDGELYIAGDGLARGYLNRPELTAQRFIKTANISTGKYENTVMYRTGDRAQWMPDGNIKYRGRLDYQVKIRGFRIELGEIENRLLDMEEIKEAIVIAREESQNSNDGNLYLCAYIIAALEIDENRIKEKLAAELPRYMIPAAFVTMEEFPRTTSGKVDRKKLPPPGRTEGMEIVEPRNPEEKAVAEIWKDVLNIDKIGIRDNFFAIGGDSIKIIRVVNMINARLKQNLGVLDQYQNETIEKLVNRMKQRRELEQAAEQRRRQLEEIHRELETLKKQVIEADNADNSDNADNANNTPGEVEDIYPMSDIQKGMVFHYLKDTAGAVYHEQQVFRQNYPQFQPYRFTKALTLMVEKHPALRTGFYMEEYGEPVQVVKRTPRIDLIHEDISGMEHHRLQEKMNRYLEEDRRKPFDVKKTPLWRMRTFYLGNDELMAIWVFHHAILDGWSVAALMTELNNTYHRLKDEPDYKPGRFKTDYKNYIIEQRLERKNRDYAEFWRRRMEGYKRLDFSPLRNGSTDSRVKGIVHDLGRTYIEKLNRAAAVYRTSPKNLGLAAYIFTMSMLTYRDDITVGLIVNVRPQCEDGDKILGCFLNSIPIRVKIPPHQTWKEYVRKIDEEIVQLKKYEKTSLQEIMKLIGEKAREESPFFDTLYNYVDFHVFRQAITQEKTTSEKKPALAVEGYENTNTRFDFIVDTTFGHYTLQLNYSHTLISDEGVQRISRGFRSVLDAMMDEPAAAADKGLLISEKEKQDQLYRFNETDAGYPEDKTLQQLFESAVEKQPRHTALVYREENERRTVTYEGLNRNANRLARKLRERGVTAGSIVAMLMEKTPQMIASILAIVKSGAAYLPIDPQNPPERIRYQLEDSNPALLLTGDGNRREEINRVHQMKIDEFSDEKEEHYPENLSHINKPSDMLYIIYTSGTTGKPKGAVIEHRNVVRLMFNDKNAFDFDNSDTWTMFHSYHFDFSVWEMYGALLYGGKLVLIPPMVTRDPGQFLEILEKERVTILNQTPSAFYNLIDRMLMQPGKELCIRNVIFGGEALKPAKLKKWWEKYPKVKLINMFGITETTVHVTYKEIGEKEIAENHCGVGRPIPTTTTYVMDHRQKLLPVGVIGELCVGGDGVSRGYLNRPRLTAETFVPHPYIEEQRIYKSGDLGRLSQNGEIEYIGRKDHQVQLRGFRVELGEIETRLLAHEKVADAIVIAVETRQGSTGLRAYVVLKDVVLKDGEAGIEDVREYLAGKLPDYMVPPHIIALEEMPLTHNGKIDRSALPEPGVMKTGDGIAPRNPIQAAMVETWKEVLQQERLGITDNFFNVGGDSILAIQLIGKLNQRLNTQFKIVDLYAHQTIENMAEIMAADPKKAVEENTGDRYREVLDEIERLNLEFERESAEPEILEAVYPMSDIEKAMIYYYLKEAGTAVYHDQTVYQVRYRNFDIARMNRALNQLIKKHPVLRTAYRVEQQVKAVYDAVDVEVKLVDLTGRLRQEQEQYINRYTADSRENPFNVEEPKLWRMRFFKLDDVNIVIVWEFHHVIIDGWSNALFLTELNNVYRKLGDDDRYRVEPLKNHYRQLMAAQIAEQRDLRKNEATAAYWQKELKEYKRLEFPPTGEPDRLKQLSVVMNPELRRRLQNTAREQGTQLKNLCFAAYAYMLGMFSYENDFVVGLVTNTRPEIEDGDKLLGCFLNTVPLRINMPLPGNVTWRDYTGWIAGKMLDVKAYDKCSLADVMDYIGEKTQAGNPLFDTYFNYINFHAFKQLELEKEQNDHPVENREELDLENYEKTNTTFDFGVVGTDEYLGVMLNYSTARVTEQTARRCLGYFEEILTKLADSPDEPMNKSSIQTPEEKYRLQKELNATEFHYPRHQTLARLFEQQAARTPGAKAVICEDDGERGRRLAEVNYRQLNGYANRRALTLKQKGIKPGDIVAIMVERSVEMIVGLLAVLKTGAAYLPIDNQFPDERIQYMLKDSRAPIILGGGTGDETSKRVPRGIERIDLFETGTSEPDHPEGENIDGGAISGDTAYVIYTSGSTGKPKGVVLEHRSVINFMAGMKKEIPFEPGRVLLSLTTISFDIFVLETFIPLTVGMTQVIATDNQQKEPAVLERLIRNNGVTMMQLTPSRLKLLISTDEGREGIRRITHLIVGGEAFPEKVFNEFREIPGSENIRLYNVYGPTETTVWSTLKNLTRKNDITIGTPIANTVIYILDKQGQPLPEGAAGELCIGGDGLARGYLNRPGITHEKFIHNHIDGTGKLYKTGDIARWRPDGELQYIDRIDNQVKIRGYRIELEEIERRLQQYHHIKQAVVVDRENYGGDKYLCAYVVADRDLDVSVIKTFLTQKLPQYMVPSFIEQLKQIPLSPSGKIDRNALPNPEIKIEQQYEAPEGQLEERLTELWADVLGIEKEKIGAGTNFFDLGGHSLNATVLMAKVQRRFNVRIPLAELFKVSTVREQARYIRKADKIAYHTLEPVEEKEYYPVSSAQNRQYILQQMDAEATGYNMSMVRVLEGTLDRNRMNHAFQGIVRRHDSFRTGFQIINDSPIQVIHKNVDFRIAYHDIRDIAGKEDDGDGKKAEKEWIDGFIRPFDLAKPPLLRVGIIQIREKKSILVVDMHHIVSDGTSVELLMMEFADHYSGEGDRQPELQYKDYSEWQRRKVETGQIKGQEAYWLERFDGKVPVLDIPTDYTRPAVLDFEGGYEYFEIDSVETAVIKKRISETRGTLYNFLLTVYNIMLSIYAGQDDIVVGSPVFGRNTEEQQKIIGMFVNMLPMRNKPSKEKTFMQFWQEVRENAVDAFENQEYQFEELVWKLGIENEPGRHPLVDVVFSFRNIDVKPAEMQRIKLPGLTVKPYGKEVTVSQFDLFLEAYEANGGIGCRLNYRKRLFKKETIRRMGKHFNNIIKTVTEKPGIKIGDINILDKEEKQAILKIKKSTEQANDHEVALSERGETPSIEAEFDF